MRFLYRLAGDRETIVSQAHQQGTGQGVLFVHSDWPWPTLSQSPAAGKARTSSPAAAGWSHRGRWGSGRPCPCRLGRALGLAALLGLRLLPGHLPVGIDAVEVGRLGGEQRLRKKTNCLFPAPCRPPAEPSSGVSARCRCPGTSRCRPGAAWLGLRLRWGGGWADYEIKVTFVRTTLT